VKTTVQDITDKDIIISLILLLSFTHMVRIFHYTFRCPIIPVIAASALAYCLAGTILAHFLPDTPAAFWIAFGVTLPITALTYGLTPPVDERGYRTPLPLYIKMPIIIAVVVGLVTLKGQLQGFMTMFPMVGVLAAYEARHSLWTVCRQVNAGILMFLVMMLVIYLTQNRWGLAMGLGFGWCVYMLLLVPYFMAVTNNPAVVAVMESNRQWIGSRACRCLFRSISRTTAASRSNKYE